MRNPLYLGNFFMWFAIVLFINVHWFSVLYIMCFWMYYERIIFAEENFLRNKYGERYIEWTTKTPIFIPRLIGWKQPNLIFQLKTFSKENITDFSRSSLLLHSLTYQKTSFDTKNGVLMNFGLILYVFQELLPDFNDIKKENENSNCKRKIIFKDDLSTKATIKNIFLKNIQI